MKCSRARCAPHVITLGISLPRDSGRWEKCEFPLLWFCSISPRKLDKNFNGRLSDCLSPPRPYVTKIDKRCLHVQHPLPLGKSPRCLEKIRRRLDRATDLASVCSLRNSLCTILSFLVPFLAREGWRNEMGRKFSSICPRRKKVAWWFAWSL